MLIPRCQADPNQGIVATRRWRGQPCNLMARRDADCLSQAAPWRL